MPVKYIVEITKRQRRITTQIASRFERYFGWPAQVLLTWQLLYDIENELNRQEERLEKFGLHVYNQEIFLVYTKKLIRGLKKDRALLKASPRPLAIHAMNSWAKETSGSLRLQQILGIGFFDGGAEEGLAFILRHDGFVVAPS